MDGKTRRAFLSVINKWLMGEKRYALEARALMGEEELPNGEILFRYKTKIDSLDSTNTVEESESFETNCLSHSGNLNVNLEQLSICLDSLSAEAYIKMDKQNN